MRRLFTFASPCVAALSVAWSATPVSAFAPPHSPTLTAASQQSKSTSSRNAGAPRAAAIATAGTAQLAAFPGGGQQASLAPSTTPADPSVAAGATYVVEAVNSALFVYSRSGTQIGNPISINTLMRTTSGWAVKYPHVAYDSASGRFILAVVQYNTGRSGCTNDQSQIQVVVSGSDPTTAWQAPKTFTNQALLPDVGLGDMPVAANLSLGMTSTVVAISWDYFGCLNGTFYGSQTDVIQRADLAAGTLGVNSAVAFTGGPLGIQPAMAVTSTGAEYQIANGANCTAPAASWYAIFAITGAPDSRNVAITCAHDQLETSPTSVPPAAPQAGTGATLQTRDDRFLSAAWSGNVLWASGNTGCTPGGDTQIRSCLNVVSVTATAAGTVTAATQLAPKGVSGAYLYYPALAVDGAGNVAVTFDESSGTTAESIEVASITGGSTWSSFTTLDVSSTFYDPAGCSSCTWGSYSGAAQDGAHPTDIWVVSADIDGNTGGTCAGASTCWNTFIGRFTFSGPTITSLTPNSGPAGGGQVVAVAGSDFATGTTATINGTPVTISNLTPDSFTFTTPSGPAAGGVVHVIATDTLGFSSASVGSAYLYVPLSNYVPMTTPFRLFDTRSGTPLGPNGTIAVKVTGAGSPPIPTTAVAVVLNVTEINGSAASFLTVYPDALAKPNASNLNFLTATVTPNLVTVALGQNGTVDIYNALGTVNVFADVEGYFAPPVGSTHAGEFHPIAPVRVCDTRSTSPGTSPCKTHGALTAGAPMLVTVTGGAIPNTGTAAAVLNLTGVAGTASTYVSVYPTSLGGTCAAPKISTLNIVANAIEANRVMVALGPGPSGPATAVCVYAAVGRINVILDANGWFGTAAVTTSGYQYQPIAPSRICDTRYASTGCTTGAIGAGAGAARLIQVTGEGGIPGTGPVIQGVVANLTAISPTAGTYMVAYPASLTSSPVASDINLPAGAVLPNLVVVQLDIAPGAHDGAIYLLNAAGAINAIIDIEGWFQ